MRLFKAHGLGNDYLVLESGPALTAASVRAICDRHRGVGADGILEPVATSRAHHGVTIWNPDGSVAEKSGNGLRILAFWLAHHRSAGSGFTVDTGHDVVSCQIGTDTITIEMGEARIADALTIPLLGAELDVTPVNVGNPHAVVWTDAPVLDALPWRAWGEALERDTARFPHRTNVQVARSLGPGTVEARIWERGAGETLASGSSACAVAATAVRRGAQPTGEPIAVRMEGGTLHVTVSPSGAVTLTGPVAPIATIVVDPTWLAAQAGTART